MQGFFFSSRRRHTRCSRDWSSDVCSSDLAHRRLAVFQGTFKDSWAAAKMAEFMAVQQKPRYRVLRVGKDWGTGNADRNGDGIALGGAETQAFLRLLRWGEANRRGEPIERSKGRQDHRPAD